MLFIQFITLRWQKDVRDPVHAAARKAVRFRQLPQEKPQEDAVLIHSVMLRQNPAGIVCAGETVRTFGAEILSDAGAAVSGKTADHGSRRRIPGRILRKGQRRAFQRENAHPAR